MSTYAPGHIGSVYPLYRWVGWHHRTFVCRLLLLRSDIGGDTLVFLSSQLFLCYAAVSHEASAEGCLFGGSCGAVRRLVFDCHQTIVLAAVQQHV